MSKKSRNIERQTSAQRRGFGLLVAMLVVIAVGALAYLASR
jgi:hypothetical protein